MQNTEQMLPARRAFPRFAIAAILFPFCLVALLFCTPSQAWADSYSSPKVTINADIQTDGSLHVTEQRVFAFTKQSTVLSWSAYEFPSCATLEVNSVSVAELASADDSDADLCKVESVEYTEELAGGDLPDGTAYAVDEESLVCYLYLEDAVDYLLVRIDYTVENALRIYDDYADLTWKFVPKRWDGSSENVTCTVSFPVPASASPVAGQDVYAWGHGPEEGGLAFGSDAASVTYTDEFVRSDSYAQAHILVPAQWISNASPYTSNVHTGADTLEDVLEEEDEWYDESAYAKEARQMVNVWVGIGCIAAIVLALLLCRALGRSHEPDTAEEVSSTVPEGVHPALLSRLWNWNRKLPGDITVTVLSLVDAGAVELRRVGDTEDGKLQQTVCPDDEADGRADPDDAAPQQASLPDGDGDGRDGQDGQAGQASQAQDYLLVRADGFDASGLDELDGRLLDLLFVDAAGSRDGESAGVDDAADGSGAGAGNADEAGSCDAAAGGLYLSALRRYAEERPEGFARAVRDWHALLDGRVREQGYFERTGLVWQLALPLVGLAAALVCAVVSILAANVGPAVFGIAVFVALFSLSDLLPRRSQKGADLFARCLALRRWLCDLSAIEQDVPASRTARSHLAVYARAFGADGAYTSQLAERFPEDFREGEGEGEGAGSADVCSVLPSFADALDSLFGLEADRAYRKAFSSWPDPHPGRKDG